MTNAKIQKKKSQGNTKRDTCDPDIEVLRHSLKNNYDWNGHGNRLKYGGFHEELESIIRRY